MVYRHQIELTVELGHLIHHRYTIPADIVKAGITEWLNENTPNFYIAEPDHHCNQTYAVFRDEEDAMAFVLRWC